MSVIGNITEDDWQPLCDLLVEKLRAEIAAQDHNATGELSDSIESEAKALADRWVIEVKANYYGRYVNNGRSIGATPPPFQAIYEWMKVRGIGANLPREYMRKGLAWIIRDSISKKGIPPQGGYSEHYARGNTIPRKNFADSVIERNFKTIEQVVADLIGKAADWIVFNQYKNTYKHLNEK